MEFKLEEGVAVLSRTPATLRALLTDMPRVWFECTEGPDTWSPYDVVGHLIHGERTDWIPRARMILKKGETETFEPFDRFAQFKESKGKTLETLLDEFAALRRKSMVALRSMNLAPSDFQKVSRHPEFGPVTLGELLATWVAHDLGHIAQIARVMAKQYADTVGPWNVYLPIVWDRRV